MIRSVLSRLFDPTGWDATLEMPIGTKSPSTAKVAALLPTPSGGLVQTHSRPGPWPVGPPSFSPVVGANRWSRCLPSESWS